jgi:CheY-like chemotaxis protein
MFHWRTRCGRCGCASDAGAKIFARMNQVNVLVVDDDGDMREEVSHALSQSGYNVLQAPHGHSVLRAAKQGPPLKLILLDLLMPEKDGWQVLWELRHDEQLRHLPVVIMSAVPPNELHGALVSGFLEKPFSRDALIEMVRRFV